LNVDNVIETLVEGDAVDHRRRQQLMEDESLSKKNGAGIFATYLTLGHTGRWNRSRAPWATDHSDEQGQGPMGRATPLLLRR
jgi:hypothetical protein